MNEKPEVLPMPSGGGSFVRDPKTLGLVPAEATPEPTAAPAKPARASKTPEGA